MCGLDPNGLRGCPGFAFSIQFGLIQTTNKTDVGELKSLTFLARGRLKGLSTDTRTKVSSCARDALAEGLPMTEFLRVRRDLTLIGVPMAMAIGSGGRGARGKWLGSSRSQSGRLDSLHFAST